MGRKRPDKRAVFSSVTSIPVVIHLARTGGLAPMMAPKRARLTTDQCKCTLSAWSVGVAVKTITIDLEAYERLSQEKREGESFSQVIRRVLGARKMTARTLLKTLDDVVLSEDTLDRIEEVVRLRESDFAQLPRMGSE